MACWICECCPEPGECREHEACDVEWRRRADAGVCTACGCEAAGHGKCDTQCRECSSMSDPPYLGYTEAPAA